MTIKYKLFLAVLFCVGVAETCFAENAFNQLVLQRAELESRFGIRWLACFPFTENIGSMEDQANLVRNCLTAARSLKEALEDVPDAEIDTVGIGFQFFRTAGFHSVFIPWNASRAEIAGFLRQRLSKEEQDRFMEKVLALKRQIRRRLGEREVYCSQRISNDQCLAGYEALAQALSTTTRKDIKWNKVVISEAGSHDGDDPEIVALKFNSPPEEMIYAMFETSPEKIWAVRRRAYDAVQEKYGETFAKKLQLPNFFCDPNLMPEECMRGATNFYVAALDDVIRSKLWGEVLVDKYNTWITNDFNVRVRYDLPPQKIIEYFAGKPSKDEAQANAVLAEKLEGKVKGNSTGLRVVCDLQDLRSAYCANAFKVFIEFIKTHRDYRASSPLTDLMFVDGNQLARVNFALNSPVRRGYIYIDANSSFEEMQIHLMSFGEKALAP